MIKTPGDFVRGDWQLRKRLRHECTITLQDRRTQRSPDQAFGKIRITGVEAMQIGIGFPVFEQQLYLPSQPVGIEYVVE